MRLHKNKGPIETSAGLDTEVFTGEIDDGTVKVKLFISTIE